MSPSRFPASPRSTRSLSLDRTHAPNRSASQRADSHLLGSLRRRLAYPPIRRRGGGSVLEEWRWVVSKLSERERCLAIGMRAARSDRKLAHQIHLVRLDTTDKATDNLADKVLRFDRLAADVENQYRYEQQQCRHHLACAEGLLSPQVLLQQAEDEWAALESHPPSSEAQLFQDRQAIVESLIDLAGTLHPDMLLPALRNWIQARLHDLRAQQLALSSGL